MMKPAYIGVTDIARCDHVLELLKIFELADEHLPVKRKFMVGVMMSYKTLNDIPTASGWEYIWARKEKLAEIFIAHKLLMNTIHYADYEGIDIFENLQKARMYGGKNLHAIQLDMTWPDPASIIRFREKNPEIQIVLQIGRDAFEEIDNNAILLVKKLHEYHGSLDYCLLDKSMGRGLGIDAKWMLPFLNFISAKIPDLGLVVGGGLGIRTAHLMKPIISEFSDISVDAQAWMHPNGNIKLPIDIEKAIQFVNAMFCLLNEN